MTVATSDRYKQAKKVTLVGALKNALLGIIKVLGGYWFHSHALVADGIHSFADLITDGMVLIASKYGSVDADDSHPYGHQRIETAATFLLSLLLILAGAGIAWDSVQELLKHSYTMPNELALFIVLISILGNEALFHYTLRIGKNIGSRLITANAWHHRSDAASSLVVFIGLIGSLMGYAYFDTVAAIVVALMIVKMGWDYGWNSIKELIDTAVEPELIEKIESIINSIDGIERIHQLRSRYMGGDVLIDVHILVAPKISVSEGHYISQQVQQALVNGIESVKDVIVHVDPEDDEIFCPSLDLPSRKRIEREFLMDMSQCFPEVSFFNLHYLEGSLYIDVFCKQSFTRWEELNSYIQDKLASKTLVRTIRLFCLESEINNFIAVAPSN